MVYIVWFLCSYLFHLINKQESFLWQHCICSVSCGGRGPGAAVKALGNLAFIHPQIFIQKSQGLTFYQKDTGHVCRHMKSQATGKISVKHSPGHYFLRMAFLTKATWRSRCNLSLWLNSALGKLQHELRTCIWDRPWSSPERVLMSKGLYEQKHNAF